MARRIRGIIHRFQGIIRNVVIGSPMRTGITIPITGETPVAAVGNFLKEDSDALLLETGFNLLLEG